MKNIVEIAKEQKIDVISRYNIDDVILDSSEEAILVSKRHMTMITIYFLANFKDIFPKDFVERVVRTGQIDNLFGIKFILTNEK